MAFLRLPTEILSQIFEDVGAAFFKQDIGRLIVSRQWYAVARRGIFRSVTLRSGTIHKLVSLHKSGSATLASSLNYIETLAIELAGYDGVEADDRQRFAASLNEDLVYLSALLKNASRLTSLHVYAPRWSYGDSYYINEGKYLDAPTVRAMLEVPLQLEVLVLDIPAILDPPSELYSNRPFPSVHHCPAIAALLPTLRVLHVCMACICPDVLVPPDDTSSLRLEEVVISTSRRGHGSIPDSITSYSQPCDEGEDILETLWMNLEEKGARLAARMKSSKKVRVIKHDGQTYQNISKNPVTGIRTLLAQDQPWGEDGEIPEDGYESDRGCIGYAIFD